MNLYLHKKKSTPTWQMKFFQLFHASSEILSCPPSVVENPCSMFKTDEAKKFSFYNNVVILWS